MSTDVLAQLHALRDSIADALRKDPRYLTLTAIEKSIAEITEVLTAAGDLPKGQTSRSSLRFETPDRSPAGHPATDFDSTAPEVPEPPARNLSAAAAPVVADPEMVAASALAAVALAAEAHLQEAAPDASVTEDHALDAPHEVIEPPTTSSPEALEREAPGFKVLDHQPPDHEAPDHQPPDHQALDHQALDHQALDHQPADDEIAQDSKSSGYVPMQARDGAPQYQPTVSVRYGKLPNKVDFRPMMSPIEHQGETSSCVANAVAAAYEFALRKATRQDLTLSRLFIYYNARWRDDAPGVDAGSAIQLAIEGVSKFGACSQALWPFDPRLVLEKPGADAYREAHARRTQGMAQVPTKLEAWKQALAEGRPIIFGLTLFDSFYACHDRGGVVEMPAPDQLAHLGHGSHAMCAVGYSDTEQVFIVRNCWGSEWGDEGYCYIPFAYLLNPKFNGGDAWTLVPKVAMQPPRETWSDDHRPVTNGGKGVHFAIEPHRIDDYANAAVDASANDRRPYNAAIGDDYARYGSLADAGRWDEMEPRDAQSLLASAPHSTAAVAAMSSPDAHVSPAEDNDQPSTGAADEARDHES